MSKVRHRVLMPVLGLGLLLAGQQAPVAAASGVPAVTARPANDLAELAGINTHLLWGNSAYANFPQVSRDLQALGVHHIRDAMALGRRDHYDKLNALAGAGIRTDLVLDTSTTSGELDARLATIAANLRGAVEAIEPPNEWNINGGATWAADMRNYQRGLYAGIRSRPALESVDVFGPALALRKGYSDLGDLSGSLDRGNVHLYPGGQKPTNRLDEQLVNERIVAGNKPVVVTEAGYHNALKTTATHPPIDEARAGVYLPRLLLEYLSRRVDRVYDYQLYDEAGDPGLTDHESHLGLIRADGTRKPAFNAIANLLRLADDPGSDFAPGTLTYSASAPAPISQVLLQKRNGDFLLLLWQDVSVWDTSSRQGVTPPLIPVTVTLPGAPTSVTTYYPSRGSKARATAYKQTNLRVSLTGDVVALVVHP